MFIVIVLLASAGIVGASIWVGLREEGNKRQANTPEARRRREQVNLAKAAGAFPNRKEN